MADLPERQTDIGPPHYNDMLPPVIKDNFVFKNKVAYSPVITCCYFSRSLALYKKVFEVFPISGELQELFFVYNEKITFRILF